MKIGNEIKIGATILIAILISIIGFRIMRDLPLFIESRLITSTFAKVDGLNTGKKIFINGVDVGTIKSIELLDSDSVKVIMSVDLKVDVPIDSKANIRATDFLGSKAIVIDKGKSKELIGFEGIIMGGYDEGTLSEIQEKGITLGDKVAETTENLNKTLLDIRKILMDDLKENIRKTADNLSSATGETKELIEENRAKIKKSVESLQNLLANTNTLSTELKPELLTLIDNLNQNSDKLNQLSDRLTESTNQLSFLLTEINNGKGTLGRLVNDSSLYDNLDSLAFNLHKLIKNLDENPKKYLQHVDITLF